MRFNHTSRSEPTKCLPLLPVLKRSDANRAIIRCSWGYSYCAGLEVVTRLGLSRVSRIQKRIGQDLSVARSIAPRVPDGIPTILVVGNSLLLWQGRSRILKPELASANYLVDLLPIENTQFEDWYFGLRRLFAEGTRPSIVVICLSTRQLMSQTQTAILLPTTLCGQDLLLVESESQLDNTTTSAYFFANHSTWLGSRSEIRNWLMGKIMPNLVDLKDYFPAKTPAMPPKEQVVTRVLPHLLGLNVLCRAYGTALIVVIPPTLSKDDASSEIQSFAAARGIPVVVPLHSNDVEVVDFEMGSISIRAAHRDSRTACLQRSSRP